MNFSDLGELRFRRLVSSLSLRFLQFAVALNLDM